MLVSVSVPVVTKSCIWSPVANPVSPSDTAAVITSNTVSPSPPFVICNWLDVEVVILVMSPGANGFQKLASYAPDAFVYTNTVLEAPVLK